MISLTLSEPRQKLLPAILLAAVYLAFSGWYLRDFFVADLNLYFSLLLVPYLLLLKPGKYSFRYLPPALLFLGLAIFVPVKTLVYLALVFGLLFLLESTIGKVSYYLLFLLFIMSSVFRYFSNFFGFPIRLWLSKIAGNILELTGQEVAVSGNLISLNGTDFSVDPACTGLRMLATSLLLALFVLAFYQRKTGREASFKLVSGVLLLTLLLNIGANLFRIVLLVLFQIPPENIFHDLVGMACLVLYVVVPLLLVADRIAGKPKAEIPEPVRQETSTGRVPVYGLLLSFLVFSATVFAAQNTTETKAALATSGNGLMLKGYTKKVLNEGITKFENAEALMYVKPVHFYSAEHNPTVCWTGSGYDFTRIEKRYHFGTEIYTGILQKGNDKLYTAWWFDQGQIKTISQLEWRWQALKTDAGFNLVNVSATSPEALEQKLQFFLKQPLFN